MDQEDDLLYAYEIHECTDMPITVAPIQRAWMDASEHRAAYRCLPLNIANQAGWVIANPADFTAVWDGGPHLRNVHIDFGGKPAEPVAPPGLAPSVITVGAHVPTPRDPRITSHFGSGVVTFSLPYLFRTPSGVNLWVKGLSNWIKDGAQPLEGIVESDWLAATFTMNWKLTRPGYPVHFARGEPICMVVPLTRGLAESLRPKYAPLGSNPELEQQYQRWMHSRSAFNRALGAKEPDAVRAAWQKDYVQGLLPDGTSVAQHQNRLQLSEFERTHAAHARPPGLGQ